MSDDHASHAIGAYGSKFIKTPNLDRLAKEGMRFTNCFNVNSLCAPSRAAMITGRYNHHNGFLKNGDKFDGSQMTFPKLTPFLPLSDLHNNVLRDTPQKANS
jgi:arylsulfatase A-like enzyme